MKLFNWITSYYTDKNAERQEEIDVCLIGNMANSEIEKVIVLCSKKDLPSLKKVIKGNSKRVKIVEFNKRPTYNDFFKITADYPDHINAIANSDIIMNEPSTKTIKEFNWKSNYCFALSRWDLIKNDQGEINFPEAKLFDRPDSQDTWIVVGSVPQISGADFTMGVVGCDNVIAHLLQVSGYSVHNPSRNVITFHYHISNVRNYNAKIETLQPPYHLVHPCFIEQIQEIVAAEEYAAKNHLPDYSNAILGAIRTHWREMSTQEIVDLMQRGAYPFKYEIINHGNNLISINLDDEKGNKGRVPNDINDFIKVSY